MAEARRRLQERGHDAEQIDSAISQATAAGLLDDAAFSKLWMRDRTDRHPLSRTAVVQELRDKGVGEDLIQRTLAAEYPLVQEIKLASELAASRLVRLRGISPEKQRERTLGFLRRRGFSYDVALQALQAAQRATDDE